VKTIIQGKPAVTLHYRDHADAWQAFTLLRRGMAGAHSVEIQSHQVETPVDAHPWRDRPIKRTWRQWLRWGYVAPTHGDVWRRMGIETVAEVVFEVRVGWLPEVGRRGVEDARD